jgi:hypothetical protein
MKLSQTDRVLAVLRVRPVSIADFDRQPACDGGNRITRLAPRILELKRRGCVITSRMVPLGSTRVAQYTLISEPADDYLAPKPSPSLSPVSQAAALLASQRGTQPFPEEQMTVFDLIGEAACTGVLSVRTSEYPPGGWDLGGRDKADVPPVMPVLPRTQSRRPQRRGSRSTETFR